MTNYEKLFRDQLKDPEFVKAYREARWERMLNAFLDNLKDKISRGEPREDLLNSINSMQKELSSL